MKTISDPSALAFKTSAGSKRPSRMPIFLSAFVFPGAGQFAQRRWIPAFIHTIIFLTCLLGLIFTVLSPYIKNIKIVIDGSMESLNQPMACVSANRIMLWLGLWVVIYLSGLLDTLAAYQRQCSEWNGERLTRILLQNQQSQ